MRFPYHGSGICLINAGYILMAKRSKGPFYGSWSFPGGMKEKGETLEECAFREFKEETSVDLRSFQIKPIGQWNLVVPFFSYRTWFFLIDERIKINRNQLCELSDTKWIDINCIKLGRMRPFSYFEIKKARKLMRATYNVK